MNFLTHGLKRALWSEIGVFLLIGALAAGVLDYATAKVKAHQQEAALQSDVLRIMSDWFEAMQTRQTQTIGLWLDPHFQAVLTNGQVLDKNGFLRLRMPLFKEPPEFRVIKATRFENSVVAALQWLPEEGHEMRGFSGAGPLVAVFRVDGERWSLVTLIQGSH